MKFMVLVKATEDSEAPADRPTGFRLASSPPTERSPGSPTVAEAKL